MSELPRLPRMSRQRLVSWRGGWFIHDDSLESWEEYYDHGIGDVVVIIGQAVDLFFELAGRATEDGRDCHGYWVIPINPGDEFRDWPVIDHYPHGHPSHPMEDSVEVAVVEPGPSIAPNKPWPTIIYPEYDHDSDDGSA